MSPVWNFVVAHQVTATLVVMAIWSTFVSSLDAPTASSSAGYRFMFKFANGLAFNLSRALNTKVESSPNFQAAVDIQTAQAGQPNITVQPPPKP